MMAATWIAGPALAQAGGAPVSLLPGSAPAVFQSRHQVAQTAPVPTLTPPAVQSDETSPQAQPMPVQPMSVLAPPAPPADTETVMVKPDSGLPVNTAPMDSNAALPELQIQRRPGETAGTVQ